MNFKTYSHRYADIILNSDYGLKKEIEQIIQLLSYDEVVKEYEAENDLRNAAGKKSVMGRQMHINTKFRNEFINFGWEKEKSVFTDKLEGQDLKIDFWKRKVGVDVAFNHRSFIGGDLLRLQAAAEVTGVITTGVYICAVKDFIKKISPKDANSLVSFERTQWYLEKFYPVLTVPIYLIGLID